MVHSLLDCTYTTIDHCWSTIHWRDSGVGFGECRPVCARQQAVAIHHGQTQHWKAMTRIDELIMLIPVVLNLKGNLEMNLSARLGTSANMGDLDIPEKRRSIILGNLTLLQVQATVVSFFAAIVAFAMSKIFPNAPNFESAAAPGVERDLIPWLVIRGVHKKPHRPTIPPRPSGSAE